MNEIEELKKEAQNLISDFKGLEIVKRYHLLKRTLEEDVHLNEIRIQREKLQSSIKLLKNDKKDEAIKICKELQIEYDNSPLVINYRCIKEELLDLIKPLTEAKL